MSKNIEQGSRRSFFRIPLKGAPPLRGWAVRYVSGMDDPEIKSGFWMSEWHTSPDRMSATFNFEPELLMCFGDEAEAKAVSAALHTIAEVETEVVRID